MRYTEQRIQGQPLTDWQINNYDNISLYNFERGFGVCYDYDDTRFNSSTFIIGNRIRFRASVGTEEYTGNELIYYPELAIQLRAFDESLYPHIACEYALDKTLKGIPCITNFCKVIETGHRDFLEALNIANTNLEALINQYGNRRYLPIVTGIEDVSYNVHYNRKGIRVNDVLWQASDYGMYEKYKATELFDLHTFFDIPKAYSHLNIEDAMIGTPFVAIHKRQTYKHKGHTTWYSLETKEEVKKVDRLAWQPPC